MRIGSLATTLCLLALWAAVSELGLVSPLFLPSPSAIVRELYLGIVSLVLVRDCLATAYRWIAGFLVGGVAGVVAGTAMGLSSRVYRQLEFPVEFMRAVPIVSMLPLFLVFFGIGDPSKLAASGWAAFLYALINALYGARNIRKSRLEMAACYRASRRQTLLIVVVPEMAPAVVAGLRVALSMSLVVVVATEMLLGTDVGLGRRIYDCVTIYRMGQAYSAIVLSGLLGYTANLIATRFERRVVHWQGR